MHGFTATAEEMRPLGTAMARAGFPVVGVQLPGHGIEPIALSQVGAAEWLGAVEDAVNTLRREGHRVAIAGMSMGALLALVAAAERRQPVDALVLCGAALRLRNRWVRWLPVMERIPGVTRRWPLIPRGGDRGISDPDARAASPAYDAVPWRAVRELLALVARARAALPRVTQPVLALHGRRDRSVPPSVLEELRRRCASPCIETHLLERSWHVITMDVERERVAALAIDFLTRVEAGTVGRG
ncbi:MAG TPA: alpha/beta fold hydrolase [Candidatus Limnocylindria bacterium]|nr:alpha/beta fold hydrolase [Candidatus Limnocylindria bacterium]